MRGGSDDSRTPDDEPNAVDAGWDELIGETGEDDGDAGRDGAQPVTEDRARAGEQGAAAAKGAASHGQGDDEMARLMAGEAPRLPVVSAEPSAPIALGDVAVPPPPELERVPPAAPPKPKVVVRLDPPPAKPRRSSGSLRIVGAPVGREVKASRPEEPQPQPPLVPTSTASGSVPWLWIGVGALVIAAVAYVATRPSPPPTPPTTAAAPPSSAGARVAEVGSTTGLDETAGMSTEGDSGESDSESDPETGGSPSSKPRKADPREPPPGTPPEVAAVFRRLPLGFADRAPVGGIGASGIHVDHIAMGTETQGATCRGRTTDFSVEARDRAGVCVRVVHQREKEELQVLWEKHGGSSRRSKMVVQPMHAYRTRGYLVLRNEYIGDWTVHILSSDGVELARHDFTVVP